MAVSTPLESVFDVESFINEYYRAWGGTDEELILSYFGDSIVLQIPGLLIEGKAALRDQFIRPFITAFPGNHHIVKNMIFVPGVVTVEFIVEARHVGPFAGHAATGARISLPGCGVYEYDSAKRQIISGRIYFEVGTLLQTITDAQVNDCQKSEKALQTNEHNFSQIINAIPTVIGVMRADGTPVYGNQGVTDYTGLTLKDLQTEGFRARIFHPEDLERLREARRLAFTRPVPFDNEIRVLRKDGNYRTFLFRYKPFLDESGKIDRWYMAAFDIEDRKRAEDAQARQAAVRADVSAAFSKPTHLREILRGCAEAIVRHLDAAFARIWMLNKDESVLELHASAGMYTRLDGSYSRIPIGDLKVGWIGSEKKAHFTNDVVNDPGVHDKRWVQNSGMVAFAGYPLVVEDRLIGVVALFARSPLSESVLDTLASIADTIAQGIERKRAEEALIIAHDQIQQSESKLRQVIDAIPALAWCNLPDGPNEFLNKGWHEYTGLSEQESHGWGWQAAFHPEDLPLVLQKWMKMLVSGVPDEIEARLRRHDGVYRWFLIRAEPFRDESGKILRWYGTSTDIEDRKKAQEALQASERNLAAIINTIPTTAWTTRPDGYCDFLNQVWLDYVGMTAEQAQGWGWSEAIHPDDRKKLVEKWQSCLASGTPVDTEARIRRFDGAYRSFLIRANPLRDESGNILKWYGTCIDIEDRKRAEEALRVRELDARSLLDNMPGFLGRHSPDGTPEIVNRPFLQYQGKTVEEIGQWRTSDVVHPDDLSHVIEGFANGISGGQPWGLEFRLRRFDGIYRWFQTRWVPVRDGEGRILHWNALTTDIDDRKQAEAQINQVYAQLTEAQRLSQTGSFTWDVQFDDHKWSAEVYRIFEFKPDTKVTLQIIQSAIHPDDIPATAAVIGGAVTGQDFDHVFRVVTLSGKIRHARAVGRRIEQITDRPVFLGAIHDITESKIAEEALNRARAELAHMARVTTLSELTASITHEINQPIAATITNANACLRWLTRDEPNLGEIRSAVERIRKDGQRTADIIARLRSLYKKDSPGQRQLVDLNAIVSELLVLLRTEANWHSIVMRTELAGQLPPVRADRVQLQQVLMNLMLNGIEAMETTSGEMTIRTQLDDSNVLISVSDTGVGLFGHNLDCIFESFFTTKSRGTGMGLSISRSIIEAHGGRLWATNNDARGASFYFTIPAEECDSKDSSGKDVDAAL